MNKNLKINMSLESFLGLLNANEKIIHFFCNEFDFYDKDFKNKILFLKGINILKDNNHFLLFQLKKYGVIKK